jgi:hypothetical protein
MNALRVAIAAAAMVVCIGYNGPAINRASAQYQAPQEKGARGQETEQQRLMIERQQKVRERTPPPRTIVRPEGQQQNPALREECAWVGQRIVGLLFRDDPATGTDFLPFYTRFDCPADHLHKAFACVVKSGALENEVLADRIAQCWADPAQLPVSTQAGDKESSDPAVSPQGSAPTVTKPADSGPK